MANGIAGTNKSLGVIPIGSGNDFIKAIGIERNIDEAFQTLLDPTTTLVDIGTVTLSELTINGSATYSKIFFVNGIGIGFDAAVAERTTHIKYIKGTALYFLAVLQTLGRYKSPHYQVSVDGRTTKSRNLLIAIGNGTCAGGGFFLTPNARPDDGLLDICSIEEIPISRILTIMPKVMKGAHANESAVHFDRGRTIEVSSDEPVCVHADGQIVGTKVVSIKVEVSQRSLKVLVPK